VVDEGVAVTVGVGLTVMINVLDIPEHVDAEDNDGVTEIVDVIGAVPEFVAVNEGMFPVPLVAVNPIDELLFVHEKFVPVTAPLKVITDVETLLQ
jgi:hypothetical protein